MIEEKADKRAKKQKKKQIERDKIRRKRGKNAGIRDTAKTAGGANLNASDFRSGAKSPTSMG